MRSLLFFFWLLYPVYSQAQHIEATNEESTRYRQFRLKQGVECEINVNDRPIILRGRLIQIDSAGFKLELARSYYTKVSLTNLIRMRHYRYKRERLAGAGIGANLLGHKVASPTLGTASVIALSALTGLGIALARESSTFRRKDPSIYHGWTFQFFPE